LFAADRSRDGPKPGFLLAVIRGLRHRRTPGSRPEEAAVPVLANIIGPELLIVLAVVALLFGGSRLPHLARSLGSAKGEFERGLRDGSYEGESTKRES
jgi:sec-independent protein translocase protein TatA